MPPGAPTSCTDGNVFTQATETLTNPYPEMCSRPTVTIGGQTVPGGVVFVNVNPQKPFAVTAVGDLHGLKVLPWLLERPIDGINLGERLTTDGEIVIANGDIWSPNYYKTPTECTTALHYSACNSAATLKETATLTSSTGGKFLPVLGNHDPLKPELAKFSYNGFAYLRNTFMRMIGQEEAASQFLDTLPTAVIVRVKGKNILLFTHAPLPKHTTLKNLANAIHLKPGLRASLLGGRRSKANFPERIISEEGYAICAHFHTKRKIPGNANERVIIIPRARNDNGRYTVDAVRVEIDGNGNMKITSFRMIGKGEPSIPFSTSSKLYGGLAYADVLIENILESLSNLRLPRIVNGAIAGANYGMLLVQMNKIMENLVPKEYVPLASFGAIFGLHMLIFKDASSFFSTLLQAL